MNAIEVAGLNFTYKNDSASIPILKDLNLCIGKGELVAIQGPSGSGKSTLLYLLGLLSAPTSGTIKVLGSDVSVLSEAELAHNRNKNIGFVFQQFHLLPKTSVLENILLPTQYSLGQIERASSVAAAKELAEFVGLSKHLQHAPNQLSGGQQQRVAICRALMNDPQIILADEPTGNLDSASATQIMGLLKDLNRNLKKTVIIITHDNDVAAQCTRIIRIKDGRVVDEPGLQLPVAPTQTPEKNRGQASGFLQQVSITLETAKESIPSALRNLSRNKTRTALTMLGISVGIAAVLSMITLGQFTKTKILSGYAELGVGTMLFYGYPNWDQKATDIVPASFRFFNWEKELLPLKKVFPQIRRISPVLHGWNSAVNYGGRSIDQDVRTMGASEDALWMSRRKVLKGRNFTEYEIEQKSGVCLIGYEIAERLFTEAEPIGEVLRVTEGDNSFGCRIIGVLAKASSNKEYMKPNLQVYLPFTYFQALAGDYWSSQITTVMIQAQTGSDVEALGKQVRAFFEQRYGSSGKFRIDSDSVLIAQMRRFLALFTLLLSSVAFVTLTVGGIGITNMMLVSVSERFREIGLRKALGATSTQIRIQFLSESMIVCVLAGLIGIALGFATYEIAIWSSTQFVKKLEFEWIIDWIALAISFISIFVVGILSGIFPSLKAEKLQVIEALRSE